MALNAADTVPTSTAAHASRKRASGVMGAPSRPDRPPGPGRSGAFDEALGQVAGAPQPGLGAGHLAAVGVVVEAEQVQQAVQRQHPQLGAERVSRGARLAGGHARGDGDVAKRSRATAAGPALSAGNESTSVACRRRGRCD